MGINDDLKLGEKGAWLSIFSYLFLAILKLSIGFFGDSEALTADGFNNTTDIVASIAVLIGLRIARIPPDHDHHYGHSRAESISSLIAAFIMITVGVQVFIHGIQALIAPVHVAPSLLTAWTALFSAIVMIFVSQYNFKLAEKINSSSLRAAALDNRSDAFVSFGAFIGILGAIFGVLWLDPLTAIIVGAIICKTAIDIFKDATFSLTDGFDNKTLNAISIIINNIDDVRAVKDIRGRTHGKFLFIDVTICVDPTLNVIESHEITEDIENQVEKFHPNSYVLVHIEPFEREN